MPRRRNYYARNISQEQRPADSHLNICKSSHPDRWKSSKQGQVSTKPWEVHANVLFERKFGGGGNEEHITEAGYQWQAKYRWQQALELGAHGIGNVG